MRSFKRRRMVGVIFGFIVLILFIITFFTVFTSYQTGLKERRVELVPDSPAQPDYVSVVVTLLSVDTAKDELVARLEFVPHGALTGDSGFTTSRDLRLLTTGNNGKQEFDFAKDRAMSPETVTFYLYGGEVSNYPFDNHYANIGLFFVDPNKEAAPNANALTKFEEIPLEVILVGATPGIELDVELDTKLSFLPAQKRASTQLKYFDIEITRSGTVIFFAIFLIILFWFLALTSLWISLLIVFRDRELVPDFFGYDGALLFAIPALRTTIPGTPPLGSLVDFVAFYWSVGIVAIALGIIIFVWVFNKRWDEKRFLDKEKKDVT